MKIKFVIEVNSFLDAAQLEETLKKQNIRYSTSVGEAPIPSAPKRKVLKPVEVEIIEDWILKNQKVANQMPFAELGKKFNIHGAIAARIYRGEHRYSKKIKPEQLP